MLVLCILPVKVYGQASIIARKLNFMLLLNYGTGRLFKAGSLLPLKIDDTPIIRLSD